ncbi:zf-HC2 domain-containing protein, partial [Candidatus Aerophobetes bacterium]|nr:zf-HC2 domain-containing protein [Candidatus Aerophobetes bacterium]
MKCEKVIKEISAYIDGEVGFLKRLRIERHLKNCNECRK